ncbi:hypothetical protein SS1G_14209 [Sclerotinia sclerotiorum 1980 UF-70]|uniref:tRNA(Phe) 7-[(3-amino-3-carboxypropyl)-4-demethylwyosine(37)-N(4)]-methyltransferase n=1 Tax=Sclerotinia sclerotiorum (strain ATCC 18683 / 1980 / Ss-1) TaxID=665079 RepID=A7F9C8_SCLS1|nr:hypothetical protein SS1G_14209 [Sclerotinia sclerotiorum 1980 UF-70]EDO00339.1 hypothetical protein SS1G_14209 [Sclerotinia sclerotiorum 1980 UF-70]
MSLPQSFISKKKLISSKLAVPTEEYDDLSPKGSVDEGIRELIDEINSLDGCCTTSSCAGRVSVFLEGKKSSDEFRSLVEDKASMDATPDVRAEKGAGFGGKGGGGRWLYVSHDPISVEELSKLEDEGALSSIDQAQKVLSAALQAGFRESGALNLISTTSEPATPMLVYFTRQLTKEFALSIMDNLAR